MSHRNAVMLSEAKHLAPKFEAIGQSRTWPRRSVPGPSQAQDDVSSGSLRRTRHQLRRRRGFFLLDVIAGFVIIGVLGLVLVLAVTTNSKATARVRDAAAAMTAAEQVAAMLHDGRRPPATLGDATVKVVPVEGAKTVGDGRWVEVTVTHNGRTATLLAVVKEGVLP